MARRGIGLSSIVGGFSMYMLSKRIELMGDIMPEGSQERLTCHLIALALVALALVLFIRGGLAAFRAMTGRGSTPPKKTARGLADEPGEPSSFDAEAALARYMEKKAAEPRPVAPPAPPPARAGFGRKAV